MNDVFDGDGAVQSGTQARASGDASNRQTGKALSVVLWITQVLLGLLFLFSGTMKFIMPIEQMLKDSSLPAWFLYFIGIAEILGGIGLIVPALSRIKPILTPVAASGLFIIMIGATALSVSKGPVAAIPAVVGVLAAFIAYGRFRLRPIPARA